MGKVKNELKDLNLQLKHCTHNLKASVCLEGEPISCSQSTKIAGNQTENLILWLAEFQCKLNSQPFRVSTVQVRPLIRKQWDPESCNEMCGKTLMKLGTLIPWFLEPSLPVEAASPPPVEAWFYFSEEPWLIQYQNFLLNSMEYLS